MAAPLASTLNTLLASGGAAAAFSGSSAGRAPVPGAKVLYVGNRTSGPYGNGTTPERPLAALFGAGGGLDLLNDRANYGDKIYVLPGHTESVSAADMGSHTGTASGFSVEGLGIGNQAPTFNWTATGSTWLLDTAGVELVNLNLNLAGANAATTITIVTPITVSANDCRIVGCRINWGLDTNTGCGSTLGAISVTGDRFEFIGNRCYNLDVAGTLAVSFLSINGCDNVKIVGNQIAGASTSTTVGPVHFLTTASTNVLIVGNQIENLKASSTKCLSSAIAGVTGTVAFNLFRVQSGIVAETVAVTPFLCSFFENYTADTDTLSGALDVAGGASS